MGFEADFMDVICSSEPDELRELAAAIETRRHSLAAHVAHPICDAVGDRTATTIADALQRLYQQDCTEARAVAGRIARSLA